MSRFHVFDWIDKTKCTDFPFGDLQRHCILIHNIDKIKIKCYFICSKEIEQIMIF